MRLLISIAILVLSVVVSARGQALRNINGFGTNISFRGNVNVFDGIGVGDSIQVTNTGPTLGLQFNSGANPFTSDIYIGQAGIISFAFIGNGAGLTNLGASQPINFVSNVTFSSSVVFNGKVTLNSNVTVRALDFITNSHPSSTTISLTNSWGAFATNNNTFFDNLAGIDAPMTNMQCVMVNITNSSSSVKTITMNARFQNLDALEGNTLFFTNFAQLLVFHYPRLGTNFYFKSR